MSPLEAEEERFEGRTAGAYLCESERREHHIVCCELDEVGAVLDGDLGVQCVCVEVHDVEHRGKGGGDVERLKVGCVREEGGQRGAESGGEGGLEGVHGGSNGKFEML